MSSLKFISNYLMIPNNRFVSFQNYLAIYGFKKCNKLGMEYGAYYHELFIRGKIDLCVMINKITYFLVMKLA